jgi:hypothetical protein
MSSFEAPEQYRIEVLPCKTRRFPHGGFEPPGQDNAEGIETRQVECDHAACDQESTGD